MTVICNLAAAEQPQDLTSVYNLMMYQLRSTTKKSKATGIFRKQK
jgi:hypothetical protein